QPAVVFDYLAQEVFDQQPPELQSFLLHTAVLERMTPSLCEALFQPAPVLPGAPPLPAGAGRAWLQRLVRAQLFVAQLDAKGEWFRYHPLMAEFLRARLAAGPPQPAQRLHQRASDWFAAAGDQSAAVEHALLAADFARAAELLPPAIDECLRTGQNQTALHWLQTMPDALIRANRPLCLLAAWVYMLHQRLPQADAYIEAAQAGSDPPLGHLALLRCEVARQRGDLAAAAGLARQALAALPEGWPSLRALAGVNLGQVCYETGDWPGLMAALTEARRWASPRDHPAIYSRLAVLLAPALVMAGQPHQAASLLHDGLEHLPSPASLRLFQRFAHRLLAQIALERNDLAQAAEHAESCLRLTPAAYRALWAESLLLCAQVQLASGHPPAARGLLTQALAALPPGLEPGARGRLAARAARLWLGLDDLAAAERAFQPPEPGQPHYRIAQETFTLARLHLARGHCQAALALLEHALAAAQADGRPAHTAEALALIALAWQAAGDQAASLASLEQAVQAAEPAGQVRLFIDEGQPMRALLHALAAARPAASSYAARLLG
ncbi:MAG: hypothetical protein ABI847_20145, partial [Anaerolineales bacterium]